MGLALAVTGSAVFFRWLPFLAVHRPIAASVLVIEGWVADHAMREGVREFRRGRYERVYVTGGPLDAGAPLSEHKTYAELGRKVLLELGVDASAVVSVPAPWVKADRTYASAVALRDWFRKSGNVPETMNLLSVGPHARRSGFLFEAAFGDATRVGVFKVAEVDYDESRWWTTSAGVRSVLDETIAYWYARLFFRPD